jgi:hypothetical protein
VKNTPLFYYVYLPLSANINNPVVEYICPMIRVDELAALVYY